MCGKEQGYYGVEEEKKCTECLQWGKCNRRGVCEFCEDPYGQSALAQLVELEEAILRGQE